MNNISKTIPRILKENICTVFNLLNILIALLLALAGAWKNILFIAVILINTIIGIIQEIKAKRQIERLTLLSLPSVNIIRDGVSMSITPSEVKKCDIFLFESGSVICCDCIIKSGEAEINESILTGESEPALKRTGDTLLSGSTVISGRCRAEACCGRFVYRLVDSFYKRPCRRADKQCVKHSSLSYGDNSSEENHR